MDPQQYQPPATTGANDAPAPMGSIPTMIISPSSGEMQYVTETNLTSGDEGSMQIDHDAPNTPAPDFINSLPPAPLAAPAVAAAMPPMPEPMPVPTPQAAPAPIPTPSFGQTYMPNAASSATPEGLPDGFTPPSRGPLQKLFQRGGPMPRRPYRQIAQQYQPFQPNEQPFQQTDGVAPYVAQQGYAVPQEQPPQPRAYRLPAFMRGPSQQQNPQPMMPPQSAFQTPPASQPIAGPPGIPPPGMPVLPGRGMPMDPGYMQSAYQDQPAQAHSRKAFTFFLAIIVIALLAGGVAYGVTWFRNKSSPETIFMQAMERNFSTKSVTQTQELEGAGEATIKYEVDKPETTKVYTAIHIKTSGTDLNTEAYSSLKEGYFRIMAGKSTDKSAYKFVADKWLIIRAGGVSVEGARQFYALFGDPYDALFGDMVFGNFSESDRKKLLAYLKEHDVYKFTPDKVRTVQVDDKDTLAYEVSIDTAKLKAFNYEVGKIMGVSKSVIDQVFDNRIEVSPTIYVDKASKQVVKVTAKDNTGEVINIYKDYDATTVGEAPKDAIHYAKYTELISQYNNARD